MAFYITTLSANTAPTIQPLLRALLGEFNIYIVVAKIVISLTVLYCSKLRQVTPQSPASSSLEPGCI
jgi:hypothetical protein